MIRELKYGCIPALKTPLKQADTIKSPNIMPPNALNTWYWTWEDHTDNEKLPYAKERLQAIITACLRIWARPLGFKAYYTESPEKAHFTVCFGKERHCSCPFPFDGRPTGVLAHAFFPQSEILAGHVHFCSDEIWEIDTSVENWQPNSIHFQTICIHEFGHAIGLPHDDSSSFNVMNTFYRGINTILSEYEENKVRELYQKYIKDNDVGLFQKIWRWVKKLFGK